jgi:preprotein translocase subunit SecD
MVTDPSLSMPVKTQPGRPGGGERVVFSGNAVVTARVDFDSDRNKPTVEFVLDLSAVTGLGETSRTPFALDLREITTKPHRNNQSIDIEFALPAGIQDVNKVRTGLASFKLNVELASGAMSSGTATLGAR